METGLRNRPVVLLVDDYEPERDLYELVLNHELDIVTASRGEEAVTTASEIHPDAIVLDVMMPDIDGWTVCERLKRNARTRSVPIIMLTSMDDENLSGRAREAGAVAALLKPCSGDRLLEVIRTAINWPA